MMVTLTRLFLLALAAMQTAGYGYAGRLAINSFKVGEPEQLALRLGPTDNTCILSWVCQVNHSDPEYYASSADVEGDSASAYFSKAQVRVDGAPAQSYTWYSTLWTENRCGSTRLLTNLLVTDCPAGKSLQYRVQNMQSTGVQQGSAPQFIQVPPGSTNPVNNWSGWFTGKIPAASKDPFCMAIFGDMSLHDSNPTSIPKLIQATIDGDIGAVMHSGDIAYDIDDDCGMHGDAYFNGVQGITSRIPYIFGVGDHEGGRKCAVDQIGNPAGYDYEAYRARMGELDGLGQISLGRRSGTGSAFYFSYDLPLVHVVVINTNAWIHGEQMWLIEPTYTWLERDLSRVNRTVTPWVVVVGHRSMYCTKNDDTECNEEARSLRDGVPALQYKSQLSVGILKPTPSEPRVFGLEALFHKYHVDISFGGHTHHYQRSWPVYKSKVTRSYSQPPATVYLLGGIAGVNPDLFSKPPAPFEAFRDPTYSVSWGKLCFSNSSHLRFEQKFAANNSLLDSFEMHKSTEHQSTRGAAASDSNDGAIILAAALGAAVTMVFMALMFWYQRHQQMHLPEMVEMNKPKFAAMPQSEVEAT